MKKLKKMASRHDMPRPGKLKRFRCGDATLCVANAGGELRALDDACPHKGVSLSDGRMKGKRVVCPKHEWRFRTRDGGCKAHPDYTARVYPLFLMGEDVLVQI